MIKCGKYEIVKEQSVNKIIHEALQDNLSSNEADFFADFLFKNLHSYNLIFDKLQIGLAIYQEIDKIEANINIVINNEEDNYIVPTYVFFMKMFINYLFKEKHYDKLSMIYSKNDYIDENVLTNIGFKKGEIVLEDGIVFNIVPDDFYFLRNYKYLLFDADDTILDFKRAEEVALSKALIKYDIEPSKNVVNLYHLINIEHWKMVEKGIISRDECLIKRFEVFFERLHKDINPYQFEHTYRMNLDRCHFVKDNARDVLNKLELEYDLYIISNGILKTQQRRMNDANLVHYFKDFFISEMIGFNKPNIKFFEYVNNNIDNFDQSKAIVIGDSLSSDIKLANNANVASIWFNFENVDNNNKDIIPSYVIYSLDELLFAR